MTILTEQLKMVELYCENQGDKFRDMSTAVLEVTNSNSSNEEKDAAIRNLCNDYAAIFPYHVNRITENLNYTDEDY